ncbi:HAMP domain-containing sensor histidine kinase [Rhizobium paknamense]|uniref:histidine kinase n=1 Tax=Rhizobium paknamense TaxID=1206817 RepID=A0ABU0IDV7_9HYPH|nr:HAMP domain-containing sensor histidine kinase [Rhizobium paknamense]MDQ0456417.1 signal transduction histidine kinase [Rhizobium paknamense]
MIRLFWKFFITIWLTVTLTAFVLISFAHQSDGGLPPDERMVLDMQHYLHGLVQPVLTEEGPQAVETLLERAGAEAGSVPFRMILSPIADCSSQSHILRGENGLCYQVKLFHMPREFDWKIGLPWVTAALAGLASALMLTSYLFRPVAQLRRGLRALAEGRFDVRIHDGVAGRRDEIAKLTRDFDLSAARLQELHEGRQRLFHDISHELRSPLSRLQAVTGILRQNPVRLPDILDRIDREVERLDGLVGEILTLARLTASDETYRARQALDVIDLVESIVEDATFEGQSRRISVVFERRFAFISTVDGELIYRAIENVVRNALRHAPEGTAVVIETRLIDKTLHMTVCDEGPGVAEAELGKIFRPFHHGDNGVKAGFGLGLAITRQAFLQHGGEVTASNRKPTGLCIGFILPRHEVA